MNLNQLIDFIKEVDKLKNVDRKSLNYNNTRYENSAEHSWLLALATLVFISKSNDKNMDLLKAVKMAIIHDIVEIEAGDQIVYSQDKNKFDKELIAAKKTFSLLPVDLRNEFLELWIEYEKKETPEAKYVGALDRFLPMLSNVINKGHTWNKHNISAQQVYSLNKPSISEGINELWEESDRLLKECIEKNYLKT